MAAPINGSARRQVGFWTRKILSGDCADLRPNSGAGMHHQCNHDINVAFDRVTESAVAGRDDDLEKVGPDRQMRWNSKDVNHHRHPDVTRASPRKPLNSPPIKATRIMTQSEIAFTPEVGNEIIGQRRRRWIARVLWLKEDSSCFGAVPGTFERGLRLFGKRSVLQASQIMKLEMLT